MKAAPDAVHPLPTRLLWVARTKPLKGSRAIPPPTTVVLAGQVAVAVTAAGPSAASLERTVITGPGFCGLPRFAALASCGPENVSAASKSNAIGMRLPVTEVCGLPVSVTWPFGPTYRIRGFGLKKRRTEPNGNRPGGRPDLRLCRGRGGIDPRIGLS